MFRQVFGGRLGRFGQASELPAQAHIVESKKGDNLSFGEGRHDAGSSVLVDDCSVCVSSVEPGCGHNVLTAWPNGHLSSGNKKICSNHD